jgi:hypothetical protein
MKHIRSINEFFSFLHKDTEEDKIALEFIKRLDKVKDHNPYEIEYSTIPAEGSWVGPTHVYKIRFDDVELTTSSYYLPGRGGGGDSYYQLTIDEEKIECEEKYKKSLFNIVSSIYQAGIKRKKLDKLKSNINPAADLL